MHPHQLLSAMFDAEHVRNRKQRELDAAEAALADAMRAADLAGLLPLELTDISVPAVDRPFHVEGGVHV